MLRFIPALVFVCFLAPNAFGKPEFTRTRDVIYGRKFGLAMTMDIMTPKKSNGLAVVSVTSGGWFSRPEMISPIFVSAFLERGYTVFAVVHGSQPKFTLTEIVEDMHRAIRFIRFNAKKYAIDPEKIGIIGASAGGHLSLLMGAGGGPGDPKAKDPIDRLSSKVQAVGCFFPPTDFLNYGKKGAEMIDRSFDPPFTAAVDYHEFDAKKALYVPIKDKVRLREIAKKMSPIYHITKKCAPCLLFHGDKDKLVPCQQSEVFIAKLKEMGVANKLEIRKGEAHGWLTIILDMEIIADWFDVHLAGKKPE